MGKTILLLGSGLMAVTVVEYLMKRPDFHIIIASNIVKDAEDMARGKKNVSFAEVNVKDPKSLAPLVRKSDVVISYVPWTMHKFVAEVCLNEKKNLVTASYI